MLSMLKWLRRRREARQRVVEDANRLRNQSEQLSDPDPIEELVRIAGESDPGERRDRVRPRSIVRSARRNVPRR
jgi:hypothetical protein